MFGSIGYPELIVLGIVAVLLFGSRLPQVARSVGQSYRELMRGLNELKANFHAEDEAGYQPPGLPDYSQPDVEESLPDEGRFDLEPELEPNGNSDAPTPRDQQNEVSN